MVVAGASRTVVVPHQRKHRRRDLLGKPLRKIWRLGEQDFAHAFELACSFRDGAASLARHENIDVGAEARAAVSALAVAGARTLLSCSASRRTAI